jgi:hypothetical protein
MRDPVSESLGLTCARTCCDQQRQWRVCVATDTVGDSAALSRVQVAQMPANID